MNREAFLQTIVNRREAWDIAVIGGGLWRSEDFVLGWERGVHQQAFRRLSTSSGVFARIFRSSRKL